MVLVARMRETKMVMASVVPGKTTGKFMAKREIAKVRAKKTICENSPRYPSGSNGIVERGIGSAVAQMRVMRSAVEDRL